MKQFIAFNLDSTKGGGRGGGRREKRGGNIFCITGTGETGKEKDQLEEDSIVFCLDGGGTVWCFMAPLLSDF